MMWHDDIIRDGMILPKGIDVIYKPAAATPKQQLSLFSVDDIAYGLWKGSRNGCDHEYINVGFTTVTEVCKKCNKEKT